MKRFKALVLTAACLLSFTAASSAQQVPPEIPSS